jgi:L-erythro-3,5-diaminohexanoate dehydrogenase
MDGRERPAYTPPVTSSKGSPYGIHRAVEPPGEFPQAAWKLDNRRQLWSNEVLIEVEALNVDSASFRQLRERSASEERTLEDLIDEIVRDRGKLHNPVTGSGGMLIGRVAALGADIARRGDLKVGERIATMVSLSLTPLSIDEILSIDEHTERVEIRGHAVLFETGLYAKLPADIPDRLALAVLDVAGAPALMRKATRSDAVVLVMGAGKAGLLALHEACRARGRGGFVVAIEYAREQADVVRELGLADVVLEGDCTRALPMHVKLLEATRGRLADVTFNVVNVPNTETLSILCTNDGGSIHFFSMATSFQRAALTAEGLGKDVTMLIGSGYTRGWVEVALEALRSHAGLRRYFEARYA